MVIVQSDIQNRAYNFKIKNLLQQNLLKKATDNIVMLAIGAAAI